MEKEQVKELLREYMTTPALAGYEKHMAYLFREKIRPYCDEVEIDRIGNVIGTIRGTDPESPAVMISAHMDNIGFFVKMIDDRGFLILERNGSPQEKVIPGCTLVVETDSGEYINGTFCIKPVQLMSESEQYTVTPLSNLYVDIGCDSREEANALGVYVGCPVMYTPSFTELQGGRCRGTFVDDRGGCAAVTVAAELLGEKRPASTVYVIGTVWEEFNLRGSMIANRTHRAEININVDGAGPTIDPGKEQIYEEVCAPGISMFNFHGRGTLNGCIPQEGLVRLAEEVDRDMDLHLFRRASRGGLCDTSYIQLENEGVACIDLCRPSQYGHSYNEVTDVEGVQKTGILLAEMVQRIGRDFPLQRL